MISLVKIGLREYYILNILRLFTTTIMAWDNEYYIHYVAVHSLAVQCSDVA